MAKNRRSSPKPQARKSPTELQQLRRTLRELKELTAEEKSLRSRQAYWQDRIETLRYGRSKDKKAARKEAIEQADLARKDHDKLIKRLDAERMRAMRRAGLTEAKQSSRREKIRSLWSKFGDRFDSSKYFIITKPKELRRSKKKLADFDERAKGAGFNVGKNVVFYAKEGYDKAELKFNKRIKQYTITREKTLTRTKKTGSGKQRLSIKQTVPLVGIDEISRKQKSLINKFKKVYPLAENDRLVFSIGGNYSRRAFKKIEALLAYAMKYEKTAGKQLQFINHIVIEKMSVDEWDDHIQAQNEYYSPKAKKARRRAWRMNRKGRNE